MMPGGIRQAKLVDSASQNIRPYRMYRILFSIRYECVCAVLDLTLSVTAECNQKYSLNIS